MPKPRRRVWTIDAEGLLCRDGKPVAHLTDCDLQNHPDHGREHMTDGARAALLRRIVRLLNASEGV